MILKKIPCKKRVSEHEPTSSSRHPIEGRTSGRAAPLSLEGRGARGEGRFCIHDETSAWREPRPPEGANHQCYWWGQVYFPGNVGGGEPAVFSAPAGGVGATRLLPPPNVLRNLSSVFSASRPGLVPCQSTNPSTRTTAAMINATTGGGIWIRITRFPSMGYRKELLLKLTIQ